MYSLYDWLMTYALISCRPYFWTLGNSVLCNNTSYSVDLFLYVYSCYIRKVEKALP